MLSSRVTFSKGSDKSLNDHCNACCTARSAGNMEFSVSEIFKSIQGESTFVGLPCAFVRLAGCNLRCRYCDTRYAQEGGDILTLDEIVGTVTAFGLSLVEITGGEPLTQPHTPALCQAFLDRGYEVLVETNGSVDISVLPDTVIRIMDIKCPASGQTQSFLWENIWKLRPRDEVKFVISDRHDYEWARGIVRERFGRRSQPVLFSTVFGELPPRVLVKWILEDSLPVRFQLQMHKYVWPHDARGV